MTRICAQVLLTVDENGTFRAELARPGSPLRTKIELRDGVEWTTIRAEMLALSALNRANRAEVEAIAQQNKMQNIAAKRNRLAREIYTDVAKHHSVKLANRVVPGMRAQVKHVPEGGWSIEVAGMQVSTNVGKSRFASNKAAAQAAEKLGFKVGRANGASRSKDSGVATLVSADEL